MVQSNRASKQNKTEKKKVKKKKDRISENVGVYGRDRERETAMGSWPCIQRFRSK